MFVNVMIVIGCSRGKHIAKKVAQKLKKSYSELKVKKFPDGEIYVRFMGNVKGKVIVLVQSFYGNINDEVMEVIFAAETAKDLGAKKIILVAAYFPYFRQDKRFKPGGCISIKVMGKLISHYFDKILVIDPHLHRQGAISKIFSIHADKLTSNPYIADYIKKNIKNPLIVGPDWESYKWAQKVAAEIGCEHIILQKKRISGRKVIVKLNKKINVKNKNIVIIDDIISTGNTILETSKYLRKYGAKGIYCIAVHGVFVEHALERLRKAKVKVITTNTIPNRVARIDVSGLVVEGLK